MGLKIEILLISTQSWNCQSSFSRSYKKEVKSCGVLKHQEYDTHVLMKDDKVKDKKEHLVHSILKKWSLKKIVRGIYCFFLLCMCHILLFCVENVQKSTFWR